MRNEKRDIRCQQFQHACLKVSMALRLSQNETVFALIDLISQMAVASRRADLSRLEFKDAVLKSIGEALEARFDDPHMQRIFTEREHP